MKAILLAPVDLLWNGGIGTYVKAAAETHADVGDKANDAIRVDGADLRVKVVGEGGNLGLTQRGRIEFAQAGGKVNTDALDNSAGVDCSDHEVNIKILLDQLVTHGDAREGAAQRAARRDDRRGLRPRAGRQLLAERGARREPGARGADADRARPAGHRPGGAAPGWTAGWRRCRPRRSSATWTRSGEGLTSPELATLLAHVKLRLKHEVLASELPDADVFARQAARVLPDPAAGAVRRGHPRRTR